MIFIEKAAYAPKYSLEGKREEFKMLRKILKEVRCMHWGWSRDERRLLENIEMVIEGIL